jgi:hypothetical protein
MIDKKRIEDEARHFFEWPDPKRRDTVTLTSCVIFAATIAEMVRAEHHAAVADAQAEIQRLREALSNVVGAADMHPVHLEQALGRARSVLGPD